MKKKLQRNLESRMIAGVMAGFSDYFGSDVTLWRLGAVFVCIVTGVAPLVVTYLVAWIIIPKRHGMARQATVIHDI